MAKCKGKTKNGAKCTAQAGASGFCTFHDPALGAARAAGRRAGGQRHRTPHAGDTSKLPDKVRTIDDVQSVLSYTLAELLPQENSIPRARALVTLALAALKCLEIGEIEQRLEAIEAMLKGQNEQPKGTSEQSV